MNIINKPRVFLSHSFKDKPFIERFAEDLRRSGIDYWLDTEDIPDGRPWMDEIFQNGIPVCDVVIAYYTENSLASQMVEREINSALLRQLSDSKIAFLPYVHDQSLRSKLRIDIQSLQCREWNSDNYLDILPSIVSNIWRAYLERSVHLAVLEEKSKRLVAELRLAELEKASSASPFTDSENKDFNYIYGQLSRDIHIEIRTIDMPESWKESERSAYFSSDSISYPGGKLEFQGGSERMSVSLVNVLLSQIVSGISSINTYGLHRAAYSLLISRRQVDEVPGKINMYKDDLDFDALITELRMFSLIEIETHVHKFPSVIGRSEYEVRDRYFNFTDKIYRMRYWAGYNGLEALGDRLPSV